MRMSKARTLQEQLALLEIENKSARTANGLANKLDSRDRAFHDWYRFVLSYPPHLVRTYIEKFGLKHGQTLLDPFCGTGTTLIEAKRLGLSAIGVEANPFAHFATTVKVDWSIDPDLLVARARQIANATIKTLNNQGIDDAQLENNSHRNVKLRTLDDDLSALLLANSISPLPLHKSLVLLDELKKHKHERYYGHLALALANALVYTISNLRFGPEVGIGKIKHDVPVIEAWLSEVKKIAADLRSISGIAYPSASVYFADAREIGKILKSDSIDAVITSPPYPNEKDYTRTTRLESVLLGFIESKDELRELKKRFVRSNTRSVYKSDEDDAWVAHHTAIQKIADAIEKRRIELKKDSGFERLYPRLTKLYFGGMARHLSELRTVLRPGAQLAYVVGDQASYLRVMIRTGELLADIAQELGYELVQIDLFRTRFATATKEALREEVVVLKWRG
jgi:DNA modification methylase